MDVGAARAALWARYDAGEIGADELEARLRALDAARLGDAEAIRDAVDGSVRVRRRGVGLRPSPLVVAGVLAVVVLAVGAVVITGGDGGNDRVAAGGGFAVVEGDDVIQVAPVPLPTVVAGAPVGPDCEEFDELIAERGDQFGDPTPPANPALLSDPAYLPAGYELNSEDEITPGTDPDIPMSTAAGNPPPIEVLGRSLGGELPVRMRAFVYDSPETAQVNWREVARSGLCSFDGEPFTVPDRPELFGMVVTGVIPTTAFVSWRLGDRRVIVAVEAGDGPVDAARALAGEISAAEYDAAKTAPPPG